MAHSVMECDFRRWLEDVMRLGWELGDVSEAVQSAPMIALDLMADFFSTRTDDSTFGFIMFFDKFPASEDIPLSEVANSYPHGLSRGHGFLF